MKKFHFPKLLAYITGIILAAFGITLFVKANIGITVQTVQPYILNLAFSNLSLGTWFYIINGFYFLLTIILLKRITIKHCLSFISSVLLGYTIDFAEFLLRDISFTALPLRIMIFCLSIILTSFAISLFIVSDYPLIPIDSFVNEISNKYAIPFSKVKTFFDLYGLVVALSLSFGFLHRLEGLHIGSVVMACFFGTCMGKATRVLNKYFQFTYSFYDRKLLGLLKKDLLGHAK